PLYVRFDEKIGNDPTGLENPEMLRQMADEQHAKTIVNGISRIGYMKGGNSARWKDEDFPHIMLKKAREFIKKNQDDPFFLYFSFHDIHVPRLPDYRFIGQSEMGPRGDAIVQMDWTTGQLVKTFEEMGLDKNTLIIFSSDNGPVLDDGYVDYAVEMIGDHDPSGGFRGGKYSAYEAGTRVPTIAYWPSVIEPGESDALFSQVDLFASVAELVGHELSSDAAPDSYNMLEEIMGESNKGREFMVEESFTLALRKGQWKYIEPSDGPHFFDTKGIESGMYPYPQLFDLADDVAETTNLAEENPEITRELSEKLREIKKAIGTREGFKGK
ncbi:MAG: sulfatase-like hydrolase/transferase, partial [Bacteroidota bacterium]